MRLTWTIKGLREVSNKRLILTLIQERQSTLNPYAPLADRLKALTAWVEKELK